MVAEKQEIPPPALLLGLGGLIPFIASALFIWMPSPIAELAPQLPFQSSDPVALATMALGAYGAVILSFLGGVRWGNLLFDHASLRNWMPLSLSVLPSLIAWPALLFPPTPMIILLCVGFILQYVLDVKAAKRGLLPSWFLRLRMILTSGAVLSLLAGLIATL